MLHRYANHIVCACYRLPRQSVTLRSHHDSQSFFRQESLIID